MTDEELLEQWDFATQEAEASDNWELVSNIELELVRRSLHPEYEGPQGEAEYAKLLEERK